MNNNHEKNELEINIWKSLTKKDKKVLGVFFLICMTIIFFGVLKSDKWGLGTATIPVDIISILLVTCIPFGSWIISKWEIEASIIIYAESLAMIAVIMVHRYYPDPIIIGWFITMIITKIINLVLSKDRRANEFLLPIICTVVGLVSMLLFDKDTVVVHNVRSYYYMVGSVLCAVFLSIIISKVDRRRDRRDCE